MTRAHLLSAPQEGWEGVNELVLYTVLARAKALLFSETYDIEK